MIGKRLYRKVREAAVARTEPEVLRSLAYTYWTFLVFFTVITAVLTIAYGAWEFSKPLAGEGGSSVTVGAPRASLNRADIISTMQAFDERAVRFEARQAQPVVARDPS